MDAQEAEALMRGQQSLFQYMFGFVDSMALKCAVELRLADIIHSRGQPMTLNQIAESITGSVSPDIASLVRVMRLLVRRDIFAAHQPSEGGDTLYGLTDASRLLVTESEPNLVGMVAMFGHPLMLDPWHQLGQCVKEGGVPFEKAHGMGSWDLAAKDPVYNKLFNDAMECGTKTTTQAIIGSYRDGFGCIGSLVDVGGGTGKMITEIVRAFPHVRGINFDLPHVVATAAPSHPGVEHVSGSMFESIPAADAIFMKMILHDWQDEDCVRILKNCKKAIPEERGKLIIVDVVLRPEGHGPLDDTGVVSDVIMLVANGGKERTELEWKKLLAEGGFPRYKIIKMPGLHSIIEAYPN